MTFLVHVGLLAIIFLDEKTESMNEVTIKLSVLAVKPTDLGSNLGSHNLVNLLEPQFNN